MQSFDRSRDRLTADGCFVMDDFVGPTRFQWSDRDLELAGRVRELLPERYLVSPMDPESRLSRRITRPSVTGMIAADPTEAADSSRILPSVMQTFPGAAITLTGGCLYHLALNDVIANFDEVVDLPLLQAILLADESLAAAGMTHYAVALAQPRTAATRCGPTTPRNRIGMTWNRVWRLIERAVAATGSSSNKTASS